MQKLILLTGLLLTWQPVAAQVELIVRPEQEAVPSFSRLVESFSSKSGEDNASALFTDVIGAKPVFGRASSTAKMQQTRPYAITLAVPDSATFHAVKRRWERRPDVASVEPNASFRLTAAPNPTPFLVADPLADSLDHLDAIQARAAWAITAGDPTVRIGLIDTGLDLDHPDLASQLWINPGEDVNGNGRVDPGDWNGVDDDGNGLVDDLYGYDFVDRPEVVEAGDYGERDPDPSADPDGPFSGHATAVAGAMSAARGNDTGIAGVVPGARLLPLRAFGGDGRGATDDIAAAIMYAVDLGVDVVNLSFGRDYASPLLEETIQYAVDQGTVVVASAGNNGGDDPHYPSDYPEVISVAWLNADGTDIAARGEYGMGIDLGAPGTGIFTTLKSPPNAAPTAENLYGRQSGSSMAAPLVTGTVALLRSLDSTLSPASIRSILTASAVDLGTPEWDHQTAAGRLDVAAALARALPARTAITAPDHNSGTAAAALPIVGTVIDPAFAHYAVYYTEGTHDLDARADWTQLVGPVSRQALNDTLAVLPAESLSEGSYTLRLVTTLRDGQTVEDRRRLYIDRTPPEMNLYLVQDGLIEGTHGVIVDVASDDFTTARMRITRDGRSHTVRSAVRNERHGLTWPDERGTGGPTGVRVTLTNPSGLTTQFDTTVHIPARQTNEALFAEETLSVPHGVLLPQTTNFDDDPLQEIVLNPYEQGALGDTLRSFEWDGAGFSPADTLVANVIPRDVGDTDGNDRQELLTQVGGATLLLEQSPGGGFPTEERFVDTTGLRTPEADEALWGARLTDLDQDGRGEILAHNRTAWRVLEWDGAAFTEVARLDNPTGAGSADPAVTPNGFQQPETVVADLDGDGRTNVLVGDNDGDWIIYEATGDDQYEVVWTHETDRVDAGARFAAGDADGDGDTDFVTYTQRLPILRADGTREPPIGIYYFWETQDDDAYVLRRTVPVLGTGTADGSITMVDFDGDGRDEVAIAHPPDLYVWAFDAQDGWQLRYHRGIDEAPGAGLWSPALVAADFDDDGHPELIAGTADGQLHRWRYQAAAAQYPPPQWVTARAQSDSAVRLRWRAPQADSVTVFRGPPDGALDPVTTVTDSTVVLPASARQRYALQAWFAGASSPLATARTVRPHAPAVVEEVTYPSPSAVALQFSEPMADAIEARQFQLDAGSSPASLVRPADPRRLVLQFETPPQPRNDVLRWKSLRDAGGLPVADRAVSVRFPQPPDKTLVVEQWTVEGRDAVTLEFNAPLRAETARDPANYRLTPHGAVSRIQFDAAQPHRVRVEVNGVVLGAVGASVALRMNGLRSTAGAMLPSEGVALRLVEPADDLSDVYVYPNPYHQQRHGAHVTIAGLPAEATVRILSPQGTLVRKLTESGRDGGVQWNLQDRNGHAIPSGVYLIRVEAPKHGAVLRKMAVVR